MPDPLTILTELKPEEIAAAKGFLGAFGAGAGTLAWKSGKKWLADYFKDHNPKAIAKAEANLTDYLDKVASKVSKLEEDHELTKAVIQDTLENPSFSVLLKQSMISAAKTDDATKHDLIATLISQRIGRSSESLLALTSPLACEAISASKDTHLKILGLLSSMYLTTKFPQVSSRKDFVQFCTGWFNHRFKPYQDLKFDNFDLLHLEALSCLRNTPLTNRPLDSIFKQIWKTEKFVLTTKDLTHFDGGQTLLRHWNEGKLGETMPTSVGILIGIIVSDSICGARKTTLEGWD